MTRKDFQMIADVVKMIDDKDTRHTVAMNFAVKLKDVNPRFNMNLFVSACQPKPAPVIGGLNEC